MPESILTPCSFNSPTPTINLNTLRGTTGKVHGLTQLLILSAGRSIGHMHTLMSRVTGVIKQITRGWSVLFFCLFLNLADFKKITSWAADKSDKLVDSSITPSLHRDLQPRAGTFRSPPVLYVQIHTRVDLLYIYTTRSNHRVTEPIEINWTVYEVICGSSGAPCHDHPQLRYRHKFSFFPHSPLSTPFSAIAMTYVPDGFHHEAVRYTIMLCTLP